MSNRTRKRNHRADIDKYIDILKGILAKLEILVKKMKESNDQLEESMKWLTRLDEIGSLISAGTPLTSEELAWLEEFSPRLFSVVTNEFRPRVIRLEETLK